MGKLRNLSFAVVAFCVLTLLPGVIGCGWLKPHPIQPPPPTPTPTPGPSRSPLPYNIVPIIGRGFPPRPTPSVAPFAAIALGNGINYNGGPIIPTPHVFFIWYGNWAGNTGLNILPDLITGLNGSPYFNTNTTYSDNGGQTVADSVTLGQQVFDNYSQSRILTDQGLRTVVLNQLQAGALPTDANGIYFVLSSADVDQQGQLGRFCQNFCGFHDHANLNGTEIKFAFVGNIDRCPAQCAAAILGIGPNGNAGVDAMASVMAHELNETVTDPDLNAWFDAAGMEVGDKCDVNGNPQFGPTFTTPNGAPADITLGGRNFLIQENWLNSGGGSCAIAFGATPTPTPTPTPAVTPTPTPGQLAVFRCNQLTGNLGMNYGIGVLTTHPQFCSNSGPIQPPANVPPSVVSDTGLSVAGESVFHCNQLAFNLGTNYGIGVLTTHPQFCWNGGPTPAPVNVPQSVATNTGLSVGGEPVFRCNNFCSNMNGANPSVPACYGIGVLTTHPQFCSASGSPVPPGSVSSAVATDTGIKVP